MAIEKEKTLEDFPDKNEGVKNLIEKRKIFRENEAFAKKQSGIFSWAIVFSVFIIVAVYFLLPFSKVKALSVTGTNYLTNEIVKEISGIDYNTRYFLVFPSRIAKKIKENPLVEDCKVRLLQNNVVQLQITEKRPVGYRYEDDGKAYILFSDGKKAELKSEYMSILARIPFIVGFTTDDQTHLLTQALAKIDEEMIEEISEIRQYSMKYDKETLEIQMREGGYFFTDYYNISLINNYHETYVQLKNKDYCLYAEGTSDQRTLSGRACPWNEETITHEYWLDENGDYIYNKWGDAAVKHYYTDKNGNQYLDENGNPIVIPIDEYAQDIVDKNFEENYEKGYYATGILIIPEEENEKDDTSDTTQNG